MRYLALIGFTYLVTKDIVETLERKFGFPLSDKLKSYARDLEENFLKEFWSNVPTYIERLSMSSSPVADELDKICRRNQRPVISLDRVYLTRADEYLEVTRVTDPLTGNITVMERPGNEPLAAQIDRLKRYKRVVLADAGAFKGETLLEVCDRLEKAGIEIEELYIGFSSNAANSKINNSRKLTAINLFDFYEWIELRDLFGIDGRAVRENYGIRTYIPYWENLSNWASIPKEREVIVSDLCKRYYRLLIEKLQKGGYDTCKIGIQVKWEGGRA